jgi:hypothetical protein
MIANLKDLPSASNLEAEFHMFQNDEVQLINRYRPSTAKVNVHATSIAI